MLRRCAKGRRIEEKEQEEEVSGIARLGIGFPTAYHTEAEYICMIVQMKICDDYRQQ